MDDATQEVRRLLASLRSMKADNAIAEAKQLLAALEQGAMTTAAESVERIEDQLPPGTLAGFVRIRLRHLAGIIATMQDNTPTPPTAA